MLEPQTNPRTATRNDSTDVPQELPAETAFTILQNRRRRYVLELLRDADGAVRIGELSERIAARETNKRVEAVAYRERKRAYTSLYQVHLPKLAETGVIEYDRRSGAVSLAAGATDCFDYLSPPDPVRWWRRYLLLAGLSTLLLLPAVAGVAPFAAVPGIAYVAAAVVGFGLLSIAYAGDDCSAQAR